MLGERSLRAQFRTDDAQPVGEDEELAARGDVESFVCLYRAYLRPVYSYLFARLGNRQEAEDLSSLTFERAWQSLPSYRPTGSFRGWLFTIAYRALADHHRRPHHSSVPVESAAEVLYNPSAGPEESAVISEEVRGLLYTISQLSEEQKEVVTLRFMAELRYGEISRIVGKSEAAVKMIAYRALQETKRRHADAGD